jgi:glycosyltransferase involved in cell wall biosynthesis
LNRSVKISTLVNGLSTGGAEMMLYNLLSKINLERFEINVISLKDRGFIGEKMKDLGVYVEGLSMDRGFFGPLKIFRLFLLMRRNPPDIVQTWMYHADLLGILLKRLLKEVRLVWNIRCSNVPFHKYRPFTGWVVKMCSLFSSIPDAIIVNSMAGLEHHKKLGYSQKKMVLIPNGVDTSRFKPDMDSRAEVRKELGLPEDAIIIGLVARWDPLKDHETFLKSARLIRREYDNVYFLLIGNGMSWETERLVYLIHDAGLQDRVVLLGHREDIPRLTASFDIACSSSITEGFPNTVVEAMACEIPCVVTDVGDSAIIVGDTGRVVPPRDPFIFASACLELILMNSEKRKELGKRARERILKNYMLEDIAKEYERLYINLLERKK